MRKKEQNERARTRKWVKGDEKGFSIIETLVAVTIATLTLAAFTTAIVLSMRAFEVAENNHLAAKMAQEGMELAISKQTNNLKCIKGNNATCPISNWQHNLIGTWEVSAAEPQKLAPLGTFETFDPNHYLCVLDYGRYGYNCTSGDVIPGNFTRKVEISPLGTDSILVESTVSWEIRGTDKSITLSDVLFGLP